MAGMCLGLLYCGAAGQTCFYLASMFNDWALAFDILVHIIDLVLIINDWMVWHGFSVWPRFALSHRTFLGDPALCFVGLALILVFLFSPSLPKTRYDDNIIDGSEMLRTAAESQSKLKLVGVGKRKLAVFAALKGQRPAKLELASVLVLFSVDFNFPSITKR